MAKVRNVLFIMADQLRADYLSCYGHPYLQTPTLDGLARRGVRFDRAYVQSPVCGPSRMSFYTGRYVTTHGSTWNGVPLRIGEPTMGDHLRRLGLRVALAGKTHMTVDAAGMSHLGIGAESIEGVLASECGFEPFERDDGIHTDSEPGVESVAYNRHLKARGYSGPNPWHSAANSGTAPDGSVASGWSMRNAALAARVAEGDSETPYMTDRAMAFIEETGDRPWCLHLSYIKPHWPYIAPAPYNSMYGRNQVLAAIRSKAELENAHPVLAAFRRHQEGVNFSRDEVRLTVIPAYMGLIRQIDDSLGRLMDLLAARGRLDDTLIVFTSDHGDYLGDHWLGDKEMFHEPSARIPLIVVDPDPAADATRGQTRGELVEAIDLAPTFVEAVGGVVPDHILEGRSLLPLLRGAGAGVWRNAAFSELDFAFRPGFRDLAVAPDRARAWMVRTEGWKYIHYLDFRPQLYDMTQDPDEMNDLGEDPASEPVREDMRDLLFDWALRRKTRITLSNDEILRRHKMPPRSLFGAW